MTSWAFSQQQLIVNKKKHERRDDASKPTAGPATSSTNLGASPMHEISAVRSSLTLSAIATAAPHVRFLPLWPVWRQASSF